MFGGCSDAGSQLPRLSESPSWTAYSSPSQATVRLHDRLLAEKPNVNARIVRITRAADLHPRRSLPYAKGNMSR